MENDVSKTPGLTAEQVRNLLVAAAPGRASDVRSAPETPGVYAWWSREPAIGGVNGTPHGSSFLYYIGKAGTSLRGRLGQHVSGTTRNSTLRTTFAALWQPEYHWATASVRTNPGESDRAAKFRTVLASPQDEGALSEQMAETLLVSWVVHPDPAEVEQSVINLLRPPLNLQHNQHHADYGQVQALRSAFNASPRVSTASPAPLPMSDVDQLRQALRGFARDREWDQFHTPKNLAMALAGEVGELLSEIQWLTEEQIAAQVAQEPLRGRVTDEIADVLMYLVRFADICGIDPLLAAWDKIERNETRYPVDKARGNARKYTDLADEDQA